MQKISSYHKSTLKRVFDLFFSIFGLLVLSPVYLLIFLLLKLINHGPVFFVQERIGIGGRTFKMIKFRTMEVGSHSKQKKYKRLNEADGPVFKIYDDPRFTKFGKILAHTGLDELPQLINIIRGEMSLVGPRPLPLSEAKNLPLRYKERELVKPGATSSWVVNGSHKLTFSKWMGLDLKYVQNANFIMDLKIIAQTIGIIGSVLGEKVLHKISGK